MSFAKDCLTPLQFEKAKKYDDYADFAVAGKKLNKYLSNNMRNDIIKLGCPISVPGEVEIKQAWKFDKLKCQELKKMPQISSNCQKK